MFRNDLRVQDSEVTYYLFTRDNVSKSVQINEENQFHNAKPFVFLIHGWTENKDKQWYHSLKDAILEKDDANVILVDYERPAGEAYFVAVQLAPEVGK